MNGDALPEPAKDAAPKPNLFAAAEWRIICSVLVLATITLFALALIELRNERLAFRLLSIIGLHAVGARAPAILFCLAHGMDPAVTLFLNFYIEVLIVVLVYYTFVLVVREYVENKFLHLAAKQAEAAAQQHITRLKKYELAGLFLLVMAPLPMTGPVTGAIVGYLLNLRPWRTFLIVLSGTFCALSAYVFLGQVILRRLIVFQQEYWNVAAVAITVIIGAFTIFHVRSIYSWVKSLSDPEDFRQRSGKSAATPDEDDE